MVIMPRSSSVKLGLISRQTKGKALISSLRLPGEAFLNEIRNSWYEKTTGKVMLFVSHSLIIVSLLREVTGSSKRKAQTQ